MIEKVSVCVMIMVIFLICGSGFYHEIKNREKADKLCHPYQRVSQFFYENSIRAVCYDSTGMFVVK